MRRRRRWQRQDGQVSAELAILTPLLLVLVFGAVQFGLWRHAVNTAHTAAQEGARAARAEQGTAAAGQARAQQFLTQLGGDLLNDVDVQATRGPDTTRVEITGTVEAIVLGIPLPVQAVTESPTEVFRPDLGEPPP